MHGNLCQLAESPHRCRGRITPDRGAKTTEAPVTFPVLLPADLTTAGQP